jgi:hypothetical protein
MEPILIRVGIEYPIDYQDIKGNKKVFEGSYYFDLTLLPLDISLNNDIPTLIIEKETIEYLYNHIKDAYKSRMRRGRWQAPKDWVESIDFPQGYKFRFIGYNYKNPQGSGKTRTSANWDEKLSEILRLELNYHYGLYKTIQNNKTMSKLNNPEVNNLISQLHILSETMVNFNHSQENKENVAIIARVRTISNTYSEELDSLVKDLTKVEAEQQKLDLGESETVVNAKIPASKETLKIAGEKSEKSTEAPKKDFKDAKADKTTKQFPADSTKIVNSGTSTKENTTVSNVENQSSTKEEIVKDKVEETITVESIFRLVIDKALEILQSTTPKTDFKKEERVIIKDMLKKIPEGTKLTFVLPEGNKEIVKSNNGLDRLVNLARDMAKLEIKTSLLATHTAEETQDLSKEAIIAAAEEAAAEGKEIIDESVGHATDKVEVVREEPAKQDMVDEAAQAIKEAQKLGEKKDVSTIPTEPTALEKSTEQEKSSQKKDAPAQATKETKVATLDNGITSEQLYKEAENLDEYNKYLLNDVKYVDAQDKIEGKDFNEYAKAMLKLARNTDPEWLATMNLKPGMIKSRKIVKDETYYSIIGGNIPEGANLDKTNVPLFNSDINNYVVKLLATESFVKAKTTLVKAKAA